MTPSFNSLVKATAANEGRYTVRIVNGPNGCSLQCADMEFAQKQRKAMRAKKKVTPKEERIFDASRAARRTGKNIVKTLHEIESWDGFLTLYVPTTRNTDVDLTKSKRTTLCRRLIELKDCLAHFAKAFANEYPTGWFSYWLEVNKFDQIHVHACVKSGLSPREFSAWATPVWRNICRTKRPAMNQRKGGKRPVKVTPYHPNQVGYACRKRKWQCRVMLVGIANDLRVKTTGFIGKKNCCFIQPELIAVDSETLTQIADTIVGELRKAPQKQFSVCSAGVNMPSQKKFVLNIIQIARLQNGNFWHGFISTDLLYRVKSVVPEISFVPPEYVCGSSRLSSSVNVGLAA